MNRPAFDFLISSQLPDGGWAYAPAQAASVEATSVVILALSALSAGEAAMTRGAAWLLSAQNTDGGWGSTAGDRVSGWQTAWAVLALAGSVDPEAAAARGVKWLLDVPSLKADDDTMQRVRQVTAMDPALQGWPWQPAQATWVEPTALSLLALAGADQAAARRNEAIRYLLDRRCRGGGWNVGNPVMFDQALPPRAFPTALVLLALAGLAPQEVTPGDLDALRRDMAQDRGVLALAWGRLALRVLAEDEPAVAAELAARQAADGNWNNNPFHTAAVMLAEAGHL